MPEKNFLPLYSYINSHFLTKIHFLAIFRPKLLEELKQSKVVVPRMLSEETGKSTGECQICNIITLCQVPQVFAQAFPLIRF